MADAPTVKETRLARGDEFRFEVVADSTVRVVLTSGTAEAFGAELAAGHAYAFSGPQHVAIYSWHGCTLALEGDQPRHSYVASAGAFMEQVMQLHAALESQRQHASACGTEGPRVLLTGPIGSGKSTLCRLLANYAVRSGGQPLLVEVHVGEGLVKLPGTIGAAPLVRVIDVEGSTEDLSPLMFWLGHADAAEHAAHYRRLVPLLAEAVHKRQETQSASRACGTVVCASGWVDGEGYEMLLTQVEAFKADVIVVLGDDRLHSLLANHAASLPSPPLVHKLTKSGGVITRTAAERASACEGRWREYFDGLRQELCPQCLELSFEEVQIFSISKAPQAPVSALPIGTEPPRDPLAAARLLPAQLPSLVHSVLAVVFSASHHCDDLLKGSMAAAVVVQAVDLERQKITLLSPAPLPLPSSVLLTGSMKLMAH